MKKRVFIISVLLVGGFTFSIARTPVANKRQINHQQRIHQKAQSGELTKVEFIQLEQQQRQIQRIKKRAKADGVFTQKEKAIIRSKQNEASRNIYRKSHN